MFFLFLFFLNYYKFLVILFIRYQYAETSKDWIQSHLWKSGLVSSLVDLTGALLPAVDASCKKNSAIGCHARAQMALKQLHTVDKKFEYTDQLMVCIYHYQEFNYHYQ